MTEMQKNERDFVIPGDVIMNSMEYLPGRNTYREGESICSKKIGLVSVSNRVISVIPLTGVYVPQAGDMVLGEVVEIQSNGWIVDINSIHYAYLPLSGIREYIDTHKTKLSSVYAIGDVLNAKISNASGDSVQITMQDTRARRMSDGRIIRVNPAKVPRIIGKQGSMIAVVKERTNCRITVGQNGLVWINGENAEKVIETIRLIEDQSQSEGLTDKVSIFLGGGPVPKKEFSKDSDYDQQDDMEDEYE